MGFITFRKARTFPTSPSPPRPRLESISNAFRKARTLTSPHLTPSSSSSVGMYFKGFIPFPAFLNSSGHVCVHTHTYNEGEHFLICQRFHNISENDDPHPTPLLVDSVEKYFKGFITFRAFLNTSGHVCLHAHTHTHTHTHTIRACTF